MSKRGSYEIRYKVMGAGRDGGYSPVKSCVLTLNRPGDASKKLRQKNATIISVQKAK